MNHKKEYSCYPVLSSNSGVAVIMVLGLLSIMVLLAVSFAITMRTERLAAGNAADTVRARELVQVALARALNDLALGLGPTGSFQPDGKYPNWNATSSFVNIDGFGRAWFTTNIYLLRGEASNYVPRALWAAATNADWFSASNHWLAIVSTNDGSAVYASESNLIGRVAYLIINCSGLLDANYAGGSARRYGTNPNEIVLGGETNLNFKSDRDTAVRYETVAELNALAGINPPATNLFVYSYARPGYWSANWNCAATQVNLGGGASNLLARKDQIISAFERSGFSTLEAGYLFSNLIDYVDSDSIPTNAACSIESVPMINEIAISNRIEQVSSVPTYQSIAEVAIEWWYPFIRSDGASYQLRCTAANLVPVGLPTSLMPSRPTPWISAQPITPTENSIGIIHMPLVSAPPSADNSITFSATLTFDILLNGQQVDHIGPITISSVSAPVGQVSWTNRECVDPRFNVYLWQWTNALNAPVHSLGATNTCTTNWWNENPDFDTHSAMYIANTNLKSVAELGFLAYAPWHTVKLYGPNLHRVLDVFGLSTNVNDILMTNIVYRGRVNCNSNAALDASAAVFANMPVDQYPGGPEISNLTMPQAQSFAANIFSAGILTNLSDIGRVTPPGSTELEKESYFRNAINLINLRQNMFTLIIEAQAASGGNIPKNPARQKAVAIVWRDPFTGEMFVRHLKWLGD